MVSLFVLPNVQSQDEKVILYNRLPVKVELADDKIVSFIGEAPSDYMNGYDLTSKNTIVVDSKVTTQPVFNVSEKNAEYSILGTERIFLMYRPGFAILDKAIITELNMIASILKLDYEAKILLTAHVANESATSDKLSKNRLDAALSYLKVKGIGPDRVKIEILSGVELVDKVAISFLK